MLACLQVIERVAGAGGGGRELEDEGNGKAGGEEVEGGR